MYMHDGRGEREIRKRHSQTAIMTGQQGGGILERHQEVPRSGGQEESPLDPGTAVVFEKRPAAGTTAGREDGRAGL